MTPLILLLGIGLFLAFLLLFFFLTAQTSPQSVRLDQLTRQPRLGTREGFAEPDRFTSYLERLAKPFSIFRSFFSHQPDTGIVRRLALAGYRKPEHADIFLGARLALPLILGLSVLLLVHEGTIFLFGITVVLAFFVPDLWLGQAINRRRDRIGLSLPDGLDLLSICIEAGLGLDQAIVRVGHELRISHPDLSTEFLQINFEQRAGVPRIESWRAFAARFDLESLRSFVSMLVQTERFGTPIAQALSTFSDGLRLQRRQRAEEMAAKTTVKLVLPLALFIFPPMFIVSAGPAIIVLIRNIGVLLG